MNDDLRLGLKDRRRQRLRVEHVNHDRSRAELTKEFAVSRERVEPQTEWPWASRSGVSRRPMTPDAPARKIRVMKFCLLRSAHGPRTSRAHEAF